MPEEKVDRSVCPLCGRPNDCAMQKDQNENACWCVMETFPDGIFALIPEAKRGRACVCRACLQKYREENLPAA